MLKKSLIPKHQLGGPVARLAQQKSSGSWGNRGKGNEGQSALENGLSWVQDKISNAEEYASRGLDWAIGAIDPTMTADEAVEQGIARREYESVPHYEMMSVDGKLMPVITYLPPQGGIAPLPTLATGAPARVAEAHARLMPKWRSAAVRESQFKHGLGSKKGTPLEQTKSWQAYEKALQEYNDELVYAGLSPHETHVITDVNKRLKRDNKRYQSLVRKQDKEIRETKKQKEATKRSKYMTTGDGRNIADVGRISKKEYDLLDNYMKNSPTLRKKLVKHEARIAEPAKSSIQQKQMLESWNIERLKFLRDHPNYQKEVSKLYNMLENNYGAKLDKQLSKLK